jgi:hypothetical protein
VCRKAKRETQRQRLRKQVSAQNDDGEIVLMGNDDWLVLSLRGKCWVLDPAAYRSGLGVGIVAHHNP